MSVVTSVVFFAEAREDSETFRRLVREHYSTPEDPYESFPVEDHGPKIAGGHLYYHGFNYATQRFRDALQDPSNWKRRCFLWLSCETSDEPAQFILFDEANGNEGHL